MLTTDSFEKQQQHDAQLVPFDTTPLVSCSQYGNKMEPAHAIHYLLLHFTTPEVMYAPGAPAKSKTPVYM